MRNVVLRLLHQPAFRRATEAHFVENAISRALSVSAEMSAAPKLGLLIVGEPAEKQYFVDFTLRLIKGCFEGLFFRQPLNSK